MLVGLLLNAWAMGILWLGGILPGFEPVGRDEVPIAAEPGRQPVFFELRTLAF